MAKLLVAAQDLATGVAKGDIVEVYDDAYGWGNKEGLPNFIRATITDRTKEQVDGYLEQVVKAFDYSIVNSNANGVRATVSVNRALSGQLDTSIKQAVKDYILGGADAEVPVSLHTQTAESVTVDITLPNDANRTPTLASMRDNINDKFAEVVGYRRYYFNEAAVDTVVGNGGEWSGTAAQAVANIVDRFAD